LSETPASPRRVLSDDNRESKTALSRDTVSDSPVDVVGNLSISGRELLIVNLEKI